MGLIERPIIEPTEAGHEREPAHHRGVEQGPGTGDRRHPAVPAPPLDRARENEAIDFYKTVIKLADEAGDSTTRLMMEEIVSDEEKHADMWETILKKTGKKMP